MAAVALPRRPGPARSSRPVVPGGIYYVKQIDNSRVVRVADPQERRQFLLWLLMSALLFAAGLVHTWQRFALIRYGYALEELKGQREALAESNRQLRLEEASLRSPERIDALARANLGLAAPAPGQVVQWEESAAPQDSVVVAAVVAKGAHLEGARLGQAEGRRP